MKTICLLLGVVMMGCGKQPWDNANDSLEQPDERPAAPPVIPAECHCGKQAPLPPFGQQCAACGGRIPPVIPESREKGGGKVEYDWQSCMINGSEWGRMLTLRAAGGWRMVSASVLPDTSRGIFAYVFWEREKRGERG